MTSSEPRPRPRSGVRLPLWALGLIVLVIISFLVGSSVWLYRTVRAEVSRWEMTDPEFGNVTEPQPETAVTPGAPSISISENISPFLSAEAFKPWEGEERISILLLGVDRRCDEEGPTHSDSLMLLTIDPVSLSAAVLSIPRDLWVEIPGFGVDRINQAYYDGQVYEYPGGGQALARETVAATLGVPVDYYVAIDFNAFVEIVNLIDGIEVDVPETIDDPDYPDNCYGYDPFHIEAGVHQLDGTMALKYARTRATFQGDVDRAGRQQQVLMAVRDKVLSLNMLPQLLREAPQIWQTVQANVRTNLSLDEMVQLALLAQDIPQENIHMAVIDYNYVINQTTPDDRQVLVPIREEIRKLRDELFAPPPVPTPVIANLPDLMREEGARVAVYNGTAVFGLAGNTQTFLQRYGVNVTEIGNADAATYRSTQIIDYGTHPNTTYYLVQLMGIPPLNVSNASSPPGEFDVLIIIGSDWQVPGQ
ncbi:MAG: LCP family protein [Ardenticatenaceae bacterium]|nr:LCP family protein [Anaerolineales bacterium]MCB8920967.1 LCP family protein [Ardenticatenaceae bacterium]MCB8991607.1 LCP family protein [Ardenticatenaceae bacterium]MCB9004236.1 LCP family protein [Ardenticatenaceae bacterium]